MIEGLHLEKESSLLYKEMVSISCCATTGLKNLKLNLSIYDQGVCELDLVSDLCFVGGKPVRVLISGLKELESSKFYEHDVCDFTNC